MNKQDSIKYMIKLQLTENNEPNFMNIRKQKMLIY